MENGIKNKLKKEEKITFQNPIIKINVIKRKRKSNIRNKLKEINQISNNGSLFSNETSARTMLQEEAKSTNSIINPLNTDINTIKYHPSLSQLDFGDINQPNLLNTCTNPKPNYNEIKIFNINETVSNENNSQTNNHILNSLFSINFFIEKDSISLEGKKYCDDILNKLLLDEENNFSFEKSFYSNDPKDLDIKKRAKLINFIYFMSKIYKFKNITIFLAVQVMDRFLCKEKIETEYYELLCICCLVISSKFNEMCYPSYNHIINFFSKDNNYTIDKASYMEIFILKTINYSIFPIFPINFFDLISLKSEFNMTEYYLGSLMIELIQFDFTMHQYKNSTLAQSVFCKVINLTKRINEKPFNILKRLFPNQNFGSSDENVLFIQKISNTIDELLHNLKGEIFVDIYQKYSQPEILGNSINYFLNI
jgi:hypothetical protein